MPSRRGMARRDANSPSNVEGLTVAGMIRRATHIRWLILNGAELIWDGKVRAACSGGMIASAGETTVRQQGVTSTYVTTKPQQTAGAYWVHRPRADGKPTHAALRFTGLEYSRLEPQSEAGR